MKLIDRVSYDYVATRRARVLGDNLTQFPIDFLCRTSVVVTV